VEYLHKQAEQVIKAKLIIEVREDDKVYVTGPLDNKTLCVAMLEEAMQTIKEAKRPKLFIPTKEILKKLGTTGI